MITEQEASNALKVWDDRGEDCIFASLVVIEWARQELARREAERAERAKPIDVEWLRSIGFDNCKPCHVYGTPNRNWYSEKTGLEIWQFNDTDEWLWVEYDRVKMRTRNDLLLLIDWTSSTFRGGEPCDAAPT